LSVPVTQKYGEDSEEETPTKAVKKTSDVMTLIKNTNNFT